jgi:hypothetical protein
MALKSITITLDEKRTKLLEKMAIDQGIKKSAVISILIEKYSKEEEERRNEKR